MKLFITGGAGRLGRVLIRRLAAEHEIVAFDRADPPSELPPGASYVQADLRDADRVRTAAAGAEVVIHLGAISGRTNSIPQAEIFAINAQGTFHVLEAAARAGSRMVILASSICAIGLPDALDAHGLAYLPIDEEHPCRPRHTYDLTKRLNEITAETFTRLSGIATVCLRFPLLIDVRTDRYFATRLSNDPPTLVLADYLDLQDAVTAIELAFRRHDLRHEVVLVHAATAAMRQPTPDYIRRFVPLVEWRGEPPTATTPLIHCDRARRVLGFEPSITWQQGVAQSK